MLGGPNMCWNYVCSAAKHVLELRTVEVEDDKSPAIHKPESRPCVVRESREGLGRAGRGSGEPGGAREELGGAGRGSGEPGGAREGLGRAGEGAWSKDSAARSAFLTPCNSG